MDNLTGFLTCYKIFKTRILGRAVSFITHINKKAYELSNVLELSVG